jgi:hypothetical protein
MLLTEVVRSNDGLVRGTMLPCSRYNCDGGDKKSPFRSWI